MESKTKLKISQLPENILINVVEEIQQLLLLDFMRLLRLTNENAEKCGQQLETDSLPSKISVLLRCNQEFVKESCNVFTLKVSWSPPVEILKLFKDQCFPILCEFVTTMQDIGQESILAVQSLDAASQKKSSILWLSQDNDANYFIESLNGDALSEADYETASTSLQLRIVMCAEDAFKDLRKIGDLVQRLKTFHPKAHLVLSTQTPGVNVDLTLRNTSYIECGPYEMYNGQDIYTRNPCWTLTDDALNHIKCGETFTLASGGSLTCVACFVTGTETRCHVSNEEGSHDKIDGTVIIRLYGPNGLPYALHSYMDNLKINPCNLVTWSDFGLQLRTSFKTKWYDTHCQARINESFTRRFLKETEKCTDFTLCLMYVLAPSNNDNCTGLHSIRQAKEQYVQCLAEMKTCKETHQKLKEAALSSLTALFEVSESLPIDCSQPPEEKDTSEADIYTKMIPDIVDSLTDIFVKSTNADFREDFKRLTASQTRMNMSKYLESSLWHLTQGIHPQTISENISDQTEQTCDEKEVDKWNNSQENCEPRKNMSPDSLDLNFEWDNEENISSMNTLHTKNPLVAAKSDIELSKNSKRACNDLLEVEGNIFIDNFGDTSCKVQFDNNKTLHLGDDSYLYEQQYEQHRNSQLFQHVQSPCQNGLFNTKNENIDSSDKKLDKSVEDTCHSKFICNDSEIRILAESGNRTEDNNSKSFPRKRSSEFLEEVTTDLKACHVSKDSCDVTENKKLKIHADDSNECEKQLSDLDFSQDSLILEEDKTWLQDFCPPLKEVDKDAPGSPIDDEGKDQNDSEEWFSEGELAIWCDQVMR